MAETKITAKFTIACCFDGVFVLGWFFLQTNFDFQQAIFDEFFVISLESY